MSQIKQETFEKQAPIVIAAIGAHMVDHGLAAPMSIDTYPEEQKIRVMLVGGPAAQQAWIDSVEIVEETISDFEHPSMGKRLAWMVRLPDLGVLIELIGFQPAPFLSVVTA